MAGATPTAFHGEVKAAPRLRLELAPSHMGYAIAASICALVALLDAALPVPVAVQAAVWILIVVVWRSTRARCLGDEVPALVHVGIDRRIVIVGRDGRTVAGTIRNDTYVGAYWIGIVWRSDGAPWWRRARTVLVFPDSLPADDRRRLRVWLRYGRPARTSTSGRAAA